MKKLAIIITHPIQYYVPLFQLLAKSCAVKVFYTWGAKGNEAKYDPDFKQIISWDLPLLAGYTYEFLANSAKDQGSHHYSGIVNPKLIDKLKDFNPNAILIYGWAYQSHLKVLKKFKGKIPIWFRGDSNLIDQQKGIKSVLRSLFLKWVYQHVDKAFYVGSANQAYYLKFGLKSEQLIYAPHAIDNVRFAENRSEEALALRQKLAIGSEDILILFAGKLEDKKNPELLLKAFLEMCRVSKVQSPESEVVNKDPSFLRITNPQNEKRTTNNEQQLHIHLLFVGNGVLKKGLKLKVKELLVIPPPTPSIGGQMNREEQNFKLKENFKSTAKIDASTTLSMTNVHFMDFQNQTQMPVIYQACDLFCLPSKGPGETWGLAVNEAMASGKAVLVSTKVGCANDLVKHHENGAIFESENLNDLVGKLSLLTRDKQKLIDMGKNSAIRIKNWSIEKQAEAMLKELNN